jgi:hypothetical protein
MIHAGQIDRAWEQDPVTVRRLRSLTPQAFDAVDEAIRELPGRWTLEQHDDYEGYLSVLISPEADSDAPTYLISGKLGQVELAQFQGEELHTLGRFDNIEAAIAELVRALKRLPAAK